ncbi:ABC transporter I family member 17 [Daucus carota subsp. sativus]|uniref:ABC transporter I family member 17 n=1 Tax=Daucus carota subsp. sativus TaxID=79200 RepID=UPI0030826E84
MLKLADLETLANEPEVLLLDEPTSALDPISTPNIEDVLVKLKTNQEMTIIMVSHSIKQIQRVVDVKWNGLHWRCGDKEILITGR